MNIDTMTGLPDLSELGKDYYWEIQPSSDSQEVLNLHIMKTVHKTVESRSWWRTKVSSVTEGKYIDGITLVGPKPIDKINTKIIDNIQKYISEEGLNITLEDFLANPWSNVFKMRESGCNSVIYRSLVSFEVTDELVLEGANHLYKKLKSSVEEKRRAEELASNNARYVGKYPPKKIG